MDMVSTSQFRNRYFVSSWTGNSHLNPTRNLGDLLLLFHTQHDFMDTLTTARFSKTDI